MNRSLVLGNRNSASPSLRLTPRNALFLAVPAAIGSCFLVLAVAGGSSREFGLFYGMAVVMLAGLAAGRNRSVTDPRLPRWFVWNNRMSVPLAMLAFAAILPLFR